MPTALGLTAAFALTAWLAYLYLCWRVVRHTGDTRGLRDVAAAARAFSFRRR